MAVERPIVILMVAKRPEDLLFPCPLDAYGTTIAGFSFFAGFFT